MEADTAAASPGRDRAASPERAAEDTATGEFRRTLHVMCICVYIAGTSPDALRLHHRAQVRRRVRQRQVRKGIELQVRKGREVRPLGQLQGLRRPLPPAQARRGVGIREERENRTAGETVRVNGCGKMSRNQATPIFAHLLEAFFGPRITSSPPELTSPCVLHCTVEHENRRSFHP